MADGGVMQADVEGQRAQEFAFIDYSVRIDGLMCQRNA